VFYQYCRVPFDDSSYGRFSASQKGLQREVWLRQNREGKTFKSGSTKYVAQKLERGQFSKGMIFSLS
jgi:hypothetical protein